MNLVKCKKVLMFLFCFPVLAGKCQNKQNVREIPLIPIDNINWMSFDHEQVKGFNTFLEKHDILILSESNHGDGSSYEAQCMILKALIDSNRISRIYTESSWINIDKINSLLKEKGVGAISESLKYMRSTELRYWADNGFWEFLATKIISNEITLVGFDIDGVSPLIIDELVKEALNLESVSTLKEINSRYHTVKFEYDNFGGWNTSSKYREKDYLLQKEFIDEIIKCYQKTGNNNRVKQWQSILNFFYWMYKRSLVLEKNKYSNLIENDKQFSYFMSTRDSLMAELFLEDYNQIQSTKAVALMSSYHALRNSIIVEKLHNCCIDSNVKVLGEMLNARFGKKIYSMGFVSASGERGIDYYLSKGKRSKIITPKSNSLESVLQSLAIPYCVVDFSNDILRDTSFYMNIVFDRYLKSRWSNNLDGIFFIRKMEPLVFKKISVLNEIN